jgi:hypothetical protein
MLRESSIAQDHWESELKRIKEEESNELERVKKFKSKADKNKSKSEKLDRSLDRMVSNGSFDATK